MSTSFVLRSWEERKALIKPRVLVTGAAGNIGSYFAEHTQTKYALRLMVQKAIGESEGLAKWGELREGSLADRNALKELCSGMDVVVHLAAALSPNATWNEVLEANIAGACYVFSAAKEAGCSKVVFASSIHVVSGYPEDVQVKTTDPVNPGDIYGVSKCFGEALALYFAQKEGLAAIVVRIGAFQPLEEARDKDAMWMMDAFVSRRDLTDLICRCIDDEKLQFAIFNGLSNNRFKRLDISDAKQMLDFQPVDDFTEEHPELDSLDLGERVAAHNVEDAGQESGVR